MYIHGIDRAGKGKPHQTILNIRRGHGGPGRGLIRSGRGFTAAAAGQARAYDHKRRKERCEGYDSVPHYDCPHMYLFIPVPARSMNIMPLIHFVAM